MTTQGYFYISQVRPDLGEFFLSPVSALTPYCDLSLSQSLVKLPFSSPPTLVLTSTK